MTRPIVIRPFGQKRDLEGRVIDFDKVHVQLINPALKAANLSGSTAGNLVDFNGIREDLFELIVKADVVICDISIINADVFYQLGIRHALRKKGTLLINAVPTWETGPFAKLTDMCIPYPIDDPAAAKEVLTKTIRAALTSDRVTDSPIFQWLPSLPEVDPSEVRIVPRDFHDEVERAHVAGAKGWLRLLAEQVRGLRFEMDGLKTVAHAQWSVQDYDGARNSWEKIREVYPTDIAANLALANIYIRLYRDSDPKDPALMGKSDRAIARVLDNSSASRADRVEALVLQGWSRKTRWRLEFDNLEHVDERREAAMNRSLIESYESYRDAFQEDLNNFYPGLSALQMGTILLDLSRDESWFAAFASDREADVYRTQLEYKLSDLRYTVPSSVEAAIKRMDKGDPELVWLRISNADMLFLASD